MSEPEEPQNAAGHLAHSRVARFWLKSGINEYGRSTMTELAESSRTLSLLFADTHGFSKLTSFQLTKYVTAVLPNIKKSLETNKPLTVNTWGDGLFAAFEDASVAADCALDLRDKFLDGRWENEGLPNELAVRIALHTGSVYIGHDPVRNDLALFGPEVIRTARIEPIVGPTQIYATEVFRAQLANDTKFAFDLLGQRDLVKGWGTQKLFALRRRREAKIKAPPPSPAAKLVMPLATEAWVRHQEKLGPLLEFVDTQNFSSRVAWCNWHIKLKYDISKLDEGTITEQMEWEYHLFNHSDAPVSYPVKLFEFGDMASDLGKRSFTVHIGGAPEEVLDTPARTRTKVLTLTDRVVQIPPGDSAWCRLVYPQSWKVNPQAPVIHNCFVPRDPVLECKIEVQLPVGYSMGLFVNAREQPAEVDGWDTVYRIPLLTACQAIEYMIELKL